MSKLQDAAQEYLDRKTRKKHPNGTFDKKSRWYPEEKERQECCGNIRGPSASFPYSYMVHCRTLGHVARLFEFTEEQLRQAVYILEHYKGEETSKLVGALLIPARCGVPLSTAKIKRMAEKLQEETV